ncbi:MAG: hypothetical protein SFT93_05685 [Rickettsiaceae bacterium]|nr:hypothetical protein [Rickettsiaceae bacterium]
MTTFYSNIISIYERKRKAWLNELPELVAAISSRHGLCDLKEVTNLTYNYVMSGFQGDTINGSKDPNDKTPGTKTISPNDKQTMADGQFNFVTFGCNTKSHF